MVNNLLIKRVIAEISLYLIHAHALCIGYERSSCFIILATISEVVVVDSYNNFSFKIFTYHSKNHI